MTFVILAFSAVFLVVGVLRVVEFQGIGLSPLVQRILVAVHLAGCVCFSGAMALFALDPEQQQKPLTYTLFAAGVLTLFPVHIYVALKRRLKFGKNL